MINSAVSLTVVEQEMADMSISDMQNLVVTSLEFKAATNYEVVEVLEIIQNLQNEGVGVSNKVLCASNNLNHWRVIEYLKQIGWVDEDNDLTFKGFEETNEVTNLISIDIGTDANKDAPLRLTLQNYNGALYWNRSAKAFNKIWQQVLDNVKPGEYNQKLKQEELPTVSPQTRRLLVKYIGTVMKNGKRIIK